MCCCLSLSLRLQETVFLVDHVWQIHGRTIRVSELAIYCTINRICENAIIWIVLHCICLQSTLLWMHCHYFFLFGGWIETRPNKCVVSVNAFRKMHQVHHKLPHAWFAIKIQLQCIEWIQPKLLCSILFWQPGWVTGQMFPVDDSNLPHPLQ